MHEAFVELGAEKGYKSYTDEVEIPIFTMRTVRKMRMENII